VLWTTDFFTAKVWMKFGLITYYVLFFINVETQKKLSGEKSLRRAVKNTKNKA